MCHVSGAIYYFRISTCCFWGLNATGCRQQVLQSIRLTKKKCLSMAKLEGDAQAEGGDRKGVLGPQPHSTPHHTPPQRKPSGGGTGSPMASPHWSHKFGKLHGNLISAAALCSPTEPRPSARRHMCDGLPADTHQRVSKGDRGKSLLVLHLYEPGKELWP